MANERFENVWDALESDPVERQRLKLLSSMMMRLQKHIRAKGWTQKKAAEELGVTQPRISDLMRGKISVFSLDSLFTMLAAAGLHVDLLVHEAA